VSSGWDLFGDTDLEGVGEDGGEEMAEKGLGSMGDVDSLRTVGFSLGFD
jgi:hypothetical protein